MVETYLIALALIAAVVGGILLAASFAATASWQGTWHYYDDEGVLVDLRLRLGIRRLAPGGGRHHRARLGEIGIVDLDQHLRRSAVGMVLAEDLVAAGAVDPGGGRFACRRDRRIPPLEA